MSVFLTEKQLCECLSLTRPFLYNCRRLGMPYVRLGSRLVRYNFDEVIDRYDTNSVKYENAKAEWKEFS